MLRSSWVAQEKDLEDRDKYNPLVCQCCGHQSKNLDDAECVCDGLDWYMDKGGGVICQAHKFMQAAGLGKKTFIMRMLGK